MDNDYDIVDFKVHYPYKGAQRCALIDCSYAQELDSVFGLKMMLKGPNTDKNYNFRKKT